MYNFDGLTSQIHSTILAKFTPRTPMKKAFLSSLGTMGFRHLQGLVQAHYSVTGHDPQESSFQKCKTKLLEASLPTEQLEWVQTIPKGKFDIAVFSETSKFRLQNIEQFLKTSQAEYYLLEKPLAANPDEVEKIISLFQKNQIDPKKVRVNLSRRTWDSSQKLKKLISESTKSYFNLSSGAIGLGCNGIHFIDLFNYLCDGDKLNVIHSQLDTTQIASGRGIDFKDYGGIFHIQKDKHDFILNISADSSAPALFSVRGDHFLFSLDESDLSYKLMQRKKDSVKANYLTGHDYQTLESGILNLKPMHQVTADWTQNPNLLPSLTEGLPAHNLLFELLRKGGDNGPYQFT